MKNNPQFIQKLLQISYSNSNQSFGFYLLSKIVKNFGLISNETDQIIKNHLILKNADNAKSLFRILYYYSVNNLSFFELKNFFEIIFEYFDLFNLKMQLKHLDIVYMLVPNYPKELLPFIFKLLNMSVFCNFQLFSKIWEIIILYFQELDEKQVSEYFINI